MQRAKNYSYIKRSDISVLKATIDGKVLNVDPKDILSGSYVAKKVKSTAKKIRVAKIDSSKLRDKILNYAKKFYKKQYEEKLDPVYDSKVTTDDLDKFITCGLTEEMIMAFYCGFKSIMDIKSDGEFNYGFSGGIFNFQTEGGYIERHIKRAIYNCENNVYELGFKYPTFNWKSAGMKMSKTEVITSAEYEGWRNTKKQAILKIETFKVKTNFTVLAVKDIGEVVDGKTEARYGQNELLDPKKPLDLNNDYLALVSRNGKELFSLAKKLLSQTEGYVKDFDWLVQSKTFGAEMLTESKYKFAKGGEVIFTDLSDNTQSRKEWEGRKSKNTNQNSFGSFSHKVNNRMVGSYYIYRLDDFDEKYYAHIPLKDGEILVRVETDNMVGGEMPLVKINISNGRVYFMSEDNDLNSDYDDKNPKFNKASADVLYLSLDNALKKYESYSKKMNRKMEKGSSTYAEGGEIDKLKNYEKELWKVLKFKGQSRKVKSDTSKELHRVQEKIKTLQSKGNSTYAEGGEIKIKVGDDIRGFGHKYGTRVISVNDDAKTFAIKYSDHWDSSVEDYPFSSVKLHEDFEDYNADDIAEDEEVTWVRMSKGGKTYAEGGSVPKANLGAIMAASKLAPKSVDSLDTKIANKVSKKSFAERMSETGNEKYDNSTYAKGGEIHNAYILTSDNKMIYRRYPKKVTNQDIYQEYKNKGIEVKDTQIHFAKPVDFYDTLREETKKYIQENMNDDVDIDDIFISSKQQGNEYIATSIKGDTKSGKSFSLKPKDLFQVKIKDKAFADGGGVDFDPISYAKNAGKDAIDWMQELKNYAGENYGSLTAEEKDSIISELQMDYDFSHSFAKGGGLNDVRYIPIDAIEKVELKNGKIIENSFNEPIYSGLRVKGNKTADQIKRKEMEEKGQLSIFKKGGNLPSGAEYIPKSKVAKIYTDEGVFLGENLVGGVWYDNSKTKKLIESARKRGLIK